MCESISDHKLILILKHTNTNISMPHIIDNDYHRHISNRPRLAYNAKPASPFIHMQCLQ